MIALIIIYYIQIDLCKYTSWAGDEKVLFKLPNLHQGHLQRYQILFPLKASLDSITYRHIFATRRKTYLLLLKYGGLKIVREKKAYNFDIPFINKICVEYQFSFINITSIKCNPFDRIFKKMIDLQRQDLFQCGVCYRGFNFESRRPIIICTNCHIICQECLEKFQSDKVTSSCPECRQRFTKESVFEFRLYFKISSRFSIMEENLENLKSENKVITELNLSLIESYSQLRKWHKKFVQLKGQEEKLLRQKYMATVKEIMESISEKVIKAEKEKSKLSTKLIEKEEKILKKWLKTEHVKEQSNVQLTLPYVRQYWRTFYGKDRLIKQNMASVILLKQLMEEKRKELKTLRNIALSIQFLKPELAIFDHI